MSRAGWALAVIGVALIVVTLIFGQGFKLPFWAIYLVQVLSGNWSPDLVKDGSVSDRYFLLGTIFAIVINLGTLVGVFELWRRVSQLEEKAEMRTSQMYAMKDATIKDEIFGALKPDQFEALRPVIEGAFKSGEEKWERILKARYGKRAEKFFENIRKNEI